MSYSAQLNSKRILKNTLLLYFRMFVTMLVGLYTSRIVLDALGVDDYGLYNVVGGFVAVFTALTSSLAAATSRFITFELGKNNMDGLKKVFNISISIHILMALIIVILLETIGVWYLNNKMIIDPVRITAANYTLQFSIVTLVFSLFNVPFNAALIAHEQMDFYAYVSIFEVAAKLCVCVALPSIQFDSLIVYAFLLMIISVVVSVVYISYCRNHFEECRFTRLYDRNMLREMMSFTGWNFIGASSSIFKGQGTNIVLNYFFGTIVNAAYGLTMQVNGAINNLASGILNAINPQIIKQYSSHNMDYMFRLVFVGSRASFYMMMLIGIPLLLNTEMVLDLWLKEVPDHTIVFLQLTVLNCLLNTWSQPLITAMLATGDIKKYQLIVGGADILSVPLSYVFLRLGLYPEIVFIIILIISLATLALRIIMLKGMINLPWKNFLIQIVFKTTVVFIVSFILSYLLCGLLRFGNSSFFELLINTIICLSISVVLIAIIDTSKKEREIVLLYASKLLRKRC